MNQRYVHFLWIFFIVLSGGVACLSYYYIDKVFPLVSLSITADSKDVVEKSIQIAEKMGYDLQGYTSVAKFVSEEQVQCFVELEAGGKDAFVELIQSDIYYPYYWDVRYFKEKNIKEIHFLFSPQGEKIGFFSIISQDEQGKALSQDQAKNLIDLQGHEWCRDFACYRLIEHNEEKRDNGRVDHDFMYERSDITLGKGLYRFSAKVCGDVVTECRSIVKIPDNFIRRYQQLRSANNLLASIAYFIYHTIYFLLLCSLGFIFFYQRRYLQYRQAFFAALTIAAAIFLKGLNEYPLWAVEYNTLQSLSSFVLFKILSLLLIFLFLLSLIFGFLVIAEAAGRLMYPFQLQFFKIMTIKVVGSFEVFQQVCIGYLATPWLFGCMLLFSYVTQTYFGWWSPAGSFSDPNVLVSYFPWFGAVAISLQAGFFEEVAFRALPFAMIAFLTRKSKHPYAWLICTYILQALIFGACHANYPNQPFYARLVELIIPSFGFGFLYTYFGLLPGIITHFTFDALLFALPIFVSHLFWSKIFVVLCIILPFIIVVSVRIYQGRWTQLTDTAYNHSSLLVQGFEQSCDQVQESDGVPVRHQKIIQILGCFGLLALIGAWYWHTPEEKLLISRADALQVAKKAVQDTFGVDIDDSWTKLSVVQDDIHRSETRFIWQVYGPEIYELARSNYLHGMYWIVRFVKFHGQVEDRAEEYQVCVSSCNLQSHQHRQPDSLLSGHVIKMSHILPEHTKGADLVEEQAQKIMLQFVREQYCLQEQDLQIISVATNKYDDRRDWTFVVQDTQVFEFPLQGQARVEVTISGDVVTQFSRYIFVPETWLRQDQGLQIYLAYIKIILLLLLFFGMAVGMFFALQACMRFEYGKKLALKKGLLVGLVIVLSIVNNGTTLIFQFNTIEPFFDQISRVTLMLLSLGFLQTIFFSLILAAGCVGLVKHKKPSFFIGFQQACFLALFCSGIYFGISFLQPLFEPSIQDYSPVYGLNTMLQTVVIMLKEFYSLMALGICLSFILQFIENRYKHVWLWQLCCAMLVGCGVQGLLVHNAFAWIIIQGILCGVLFLLIYRLAIRFDIGLLSLLCGLVMIIKHMRMIYYPVYYGASIDGVVAVIVMLFIMNIFYKYIEQK